MSNIQNNDVSLPKFPALALCLLVDASHKSKNEIKKNLVAIDLFEEIVIAVSVQDAIEKLSSQSFDACFIGPSVNFNTAPSYITEFRNGTCSEDCAFIAIFKDSVDPSLFIEADSSFSFPCSKRTFFEQTVVGIVKSNKGSIWPGVRLSDDGNVEYIEGGIWKTIDSNVKNKVTEPGLGEEFILLPTKESIEEFCEGIQQTSKSKIEKIIMNLLLKKEEGAEDPFVTFFVEAVKEWKEELDYCTLKEASINLRRRLINFTEDNITE
jgi:hypothetical protein